MKGNGNAFKDLWNSGIVKEIHLKGKCNKEITYVHCEMKGNAHDFKDL